MPLSCFFDKISMVGSCSGSGVGSGVGCDCSSSVDSDGLVVSCLVILLMSGIHPAYSSPGSSATFSSAGCLVSFDSAGVGSLILGGTDPSLEGGFFFSSFSWVDMTKKRSPTLPASPTNFSAINLSKTPLIIFGDASVFFCLVDNSWRK